MPAEARVRSAGTVRVASARTKISTQDFHIEREQRRLPPLKSGSGLLYYQGARVPPSSLSGSCSSGASLREDTITRLMTGLSSGKGRTGSEVIYGVRAEEVAPHDAVHLIGDAHAPMIVD